MKAANEYQTPSEDGQIMVDPPARELPDLARANAALRASYEFDVLDIPAPTLAEQARTEMFELARRYTELAMRCEVGEGRSELVVATGHQPVLPHPGVWFKNHLVSHLAKRLGCAGVNFVVDNDTVDLRAIRAPAVVDGVLTTESVPFIECPRGIAAEEIGVPAGAMDALAEVARLAEAALDGSIAGEFAAAAKPMDDLPLFVTFPRRRIEESFGVCNFDVPIGMLAGTDAFLAFCAHIIANAERFVEIYNRVLDRHRAERGITNPVEPSPNLVRKGGRLELPFWVWRKGKRRRPMFVNVDDVADPPGALRKMADEGLKIRPRALTMTMFFRLFCCDLFVHGIGGALYEPVNDGIIREFFGVEPPGYVVASATLFVKPKVPVPVAEDAVELRQKIRRMKATPERFVDDLIPGDAEARELAGRRIALLAPAGLSKRERRKAYAESKRLAAQLQERLAPHILAVEKEAEELDAARAVVEDRTYPFFLHSRAALEGLYARIGPET